MTGQWILTSEQAPPYAGSWICDFWDNTQKEKLPVIGVNCHIRHWNGSNWHTKDNHKPLTDLVNNEIYWWKEDPAFKFKGIDHLINNTTPSLEHAGSRDHYKDVVPGYEYMDIMEHVLGYEGVVAHLRGQIFKYQFRYGKKDEEGSESEKIAWYSARLDDVVKRKANGKFPIKR